MKTKLITVNEYAKKNRISTQATYKRIKTGKVKAIKQYGLTLIKV
jgi:predicted DNA-binding protein YlxM (UPF0122 family)